MTLEGPRCLFGAHEIPRRRSARSSIEQPRTVSSSVSPTTSQSSTNTKKWINPPPSVSRVRWMRVSEMSTTRALASSARSTSAIASIKEQKSLGLST